MSHVPGPLAPHALTPSLSLLPSTHFQLLRGCAPVRDRPNPLGPEGPSEPGSGCPPAAVFPAPAAVSGAQQVPRDRETHVAAHMADRSRANPTTTWG